MLYSIVGILVIILDQATKFWVSNTLFGTDVVRFIPGVISLVNVHNDGAAFSFLSGSGARIYFIIATGVFTLLVIIALATNFIRGKFSRWCLVFVAAGGLANMIDRIIYGYVQDMFKVELFNFAIFNVADIFITVFAILFALAMIFERPETDLGDVLYEDDEEEEEKARKKQEREARKLEKQQEKEARRLEKSAAALDAGPDEAPAPARSVRASRKARQEKYEQEYEEYKAQQLAARGSKETRRAAPAPVQEAEEETSAYDQLKAKAADPFDAWEQAKLQAENSEAESYAGRLMNAPKTAPAPKPAPAPKAEPTPRPAARVETAPKPAPAVKPAPKPEPKKAEVSDEFSLEDILAEFK